MKLFINIFYLYYDGFKNMTLGKKLWLVIVLKLLVIFLGLKLFMYQDNFKTTFKSEQEKENFVSKNLQLKE